MQETLWERRIKSEFHHREGTWQEGMRMIFAPVYSSRTPSTRGKRENWWWSYCCVKSFAKASTGVSKTAAVVLADVLLVSLLAFIRVTHSDLRFSQLTGLCCPRTYSRSPKATNHRRWKGQNPYHYFCLSLSITLFSYAVLTIQ